MDSVAVKIRPLGDVALLPEATPPEASLLERQHGQNKDQVKNATSLFF